MARPTTRRRASPRFNVPDGDTPVQRRQRRLVQETDFDEPAAPPELEPAPAVRRGSVRPGATRESDPRTAAALRAQEIMGNLPDNFDTADKYYIDPAIIPEGWAYEWKRVNVRGEEQHQHLVELARAGWEPVPASRHPELMPSKWKGETIDLEGSRLYERPRVISDEMRRRELQRARQAVRDKEASLSLPAGDNQFDRNHPQAKPKIKHSYEPFEVPKSTGQPPVS